MAAKSGSATRRPSVDLVDRSIGPSSRSLVGGRDAKLAEVVADAILNHISELGWPVGTIFGQEVGLMERYGVSRATIREAIRQLERNGVASMRRGQGGGLVIQQPARVSAALALATFLELTDVSYAELFEAREIFEADAVMQAAEQMRDSDIERARSLCEQIRKAPTGDFEREAALHASIRDFIAEITHNPATALILDALHCVTISSQPPKRPKRELNELTGVARNLKLNLLQAIVAGNGSEAQVIVRKELEIGRSLIESQVDSSLKRLLTNTISLESSPDIVFRHIYNKTAHRLAVTLARSIAVKKMLPGTRLGSESELEKQYKVSHAVMREALRTLELHSIIRGQRGQGGGLMVTSPSAEYTISVVLTYLRYAKLKRWYFFQVWKPLQLAAAPLAAQRLTPEGAVLLQAAFDAEKRAPVKHYLKAAREFDLVLSDLCGNRALSLFSHVLSEMAASYPAGPPPPAVHQRLLGTHEDLTSAILHRDEGLARRSMIRYFKFIEVWLGQEALKTWSNAEPGAP